MMSSPRFWRDASGRLTFEMSALPGEDYGTICRDLVSAFRLVPDSELVTNGVDVAFWDFRRGEQVVELGWNNWTGFTVLAQTTASETLVEEMAAWWLRSKWSPASTTTTETGA